MSGRQNDDNSPELKQRLGMAANDLMALHRELYWLVQDQNSENQRHKLEDLTFDQVMDLKLAVDNIRDLLWKYVDAVSRLEPQKVNEALETHRIRRVTQLLQLLRERLGNYTEPQPVSFIEKITAAIKEKLGGTGGKAA